jgi:hypothetical protein
MGDPDASADSPAGTIRLDGEWYTDHTDDGPARRTFHSGWAGGVDGDFCGPFCLLATGHPGPHMLFLPKLAEVMGWDVAPGGWGERDWPGKEPR